MRCIFFFCFVVLNPYVCDMQSKHVLVTGGAGYIGSVLIGQLLQCGYKVRTIDNFSFGSNSLTQYKSDKNFECIHGDITNLTDCKQATKSIDTVVHLAAIVGDPACKKFPDQAIAVNRIGSQNILNSTLDNNVNRFIFASTCSNYGKMPDPNGYVDETTELNPVSLYAELKVEFEQTLLTLHENSVTPVCLRFATAYGLSPRIRLDLTVNEFTKELTLGRKLEIYGEQFWRPYCHTSDIARACISAIHAESSDVTHQAFNVGDTKENYQKKTIVDLILKQLPNAKKNVVYIQKDDDPRDYRVNFDKIKSTLNFEIQKKVEDGINEYIGLIKSGLLKEPDSSIYKNI